jgi:hypothetical protein
MWEAYEGANGWYVAWERPNGSHHQPQFGGNMTRREAEREAEGREDYEQDERFLARGR